MEFVCSVVVVFFSFPLISFGFDFCQFSHCCLFPGCFSGLHAVSSSLTILSLSLSVCILLKYSLQFFQPLLPRTLTPFLSFFWCGFVLLLSLVSGLYLSFSFVCQHPLCFLFLSFYCDTHSPPSLRRAWSHGSVLSLFLSAVR